MEQMHIKVETDALRVRADAAEQKIQAVKNKFDKIEQIVANSGNYWEGDAHDAHCREYQEYKDEIREALDRFQENVTDLRKIAGIYEAAIAETKSLSQGLPDNVII